MARPTKDAAPGDVEWPESPVCVLRRVKDDDNTVELLARADDGSDLCVRFSAMLVLSVAEEIGLVWPLTPDGLRDFSTLKLGKGWT